MLLPLKPGELQRLIPAVASGPQFNKCSGSPQQLLQRLLISSVGGVIPLLIAQGGFGSRWSSIWLVVGLVMLLYVLWGPIVQAGSRNAQLRRYPSAALFEGEIADLFTRERLEDARRPPIAKGAWRWWKTGAPGCAWNWKMRTGIWGSCVSRWRRAIKPCAGG